VKCSSKTRGVQYVRDHLIWNRRPCPVKRHITPFSAYVLRIRLIKTAKSQGYPPKSARERQMFSILHLEPDTRTWGKNVGKCRDEETPRIRCCGVLLESASDVDWTQCSNLISLSFLFRCGGKACEVCQGRWTFSCIGFMKPMPSQGLGGFTNRRSM
jgi:hypothetical protein